MNFKRSLVKFTAVLTLFFTGASMINVPVISHTQTVQAATKNKNRNRNRNKNQKLNKIVSLAKREVGKPYVWGATGPNAFDCSGLAQYVYRNAARRNITRTTYTQVKQGHRVSLRHLKKGDLLFWGPISAPYHVGIYIGHGQYVHAATPSQGVRRQTLSRYFYPSQAKRIL